MRTDTRMGLQVKCPLLLSGVRF